MAFADGVRVYIELKKQFEFLFLQAAKLSYMQSPPMLPCQRSHTLPQGGSLACSFDASSDASVRGPENQSLQGMYLLYVSG